MKHSKTTRKRVKSANIDWRRFDAMTDAQHHQAALNDPDARPPSALDLARMKRGGLRAPRLREEQPSAEDLASIAAGMKEFREGRFFDLSQLHNELSRRRQQSRAKKSTVRTRR